MTLGGVITAQPFPVGPLGVRPAGVAGTYGAPPGVGHERGEPGGDAEPSAGPTPGSGPSWAGVSGGSSEGVSGPTEGPTEVSGGSSEAQRIKHNRVDESAFCGEECKASL